MLLAARVVKVMRSICGSVNIDRLLSQSDLGHRKYAEGGFTLAELMIVVAIVVIMSAVAVPIFADYRASARDATANADAKNLIGVLVSAQQ